MSHGLFYRCIYYISGHGNITVALMSMDGHLNLCSEDEQRSYEFGTT